MREKLYLMVDKHIPIEEIEEIILSMGFEKDQKENELYLWKDPREYVSLDGCWFGCCYDIESEEESPSLVKTLFYTMTTSHRSHEDLEMQNKALKHFQDKYGGSIYNPQDDLYDYIKNDIQRFTPTEQACRIVFKKFHSNVTKVLFLVEEIDDRLLGNSDLAPLVFNKPLIRNNTLLPFLVSCLETFLKEFFIVCLKTNKSAYQKIFQKKSKLDYSVVYELLQGKVDIIEIEADEYSFQNFNSANKAYTNYLDFDLFEVLSKRVEYKSEEIAIITVLKELIGRRHIIIHEAELDIDLGKDKLEKYIYFAVEFADTFIQLFTKKHSLEIYENGWI